MPVCWRRGQRTMRITERAHPRRASDLRRQTAPRARAACSAVRPSRSLIPGSAPCARRNSARQRPPRRRADRTGRDAIPRMPSVCERRLGGKQFAQAFLHSEMGETEKVAAQRRQQGRHLRCPKWAANPSGPPYWVVGRSMSAPWRDQQPADRDGAAGDCVAASRAAWCRRRYRRACRAPAAARRRRRGPAARDQHGRCVPRHSGGAPRAGAPHRDRAACRPPGRRLGRRAAVPPRHAHQQVGHCGGSGHR